MKRALAFLIMMNVIFAPKCFTMDIDDIEEQLGIGQDNNDDDKDDWACLKTIMLALILFSTDDTPISSDE